MKQRSSAEYYLHSIVYFFVAKLLIKYIPHIPSFEIVFFRAIISLAICTYMIRQKGISVLGTNRRDLLFRGLFGTGGMLAFFYSLQHLPLATATALINLSPLFSVIFSAIFLGEKTRNRDWALFITAFLGVLILKGFDTAISTKDFAIAISGAVLSSIAYQFIRKIKGKEDPHVIVFSLSFVAVPVFLPLMLKYWVQPAPSDWLAIIAIGILIQVAQEYLTRSLQTSQSTSSVVHYTYLDVVLSTIGGFLLFSEAITTMTVAGMAIILGSVYLLRQSHKNA